MSRRVGAIFVIAFALAAGPASASPNAGPGTAPALSLRAPFAGVWAGTPSTHPVSRGGGELPTQWWRVTPLVRTGDLVQIGVDNTRGQGNLAVCLASPTDEFGADSALSGCVKRERTVPPGRLDRIVLTQAGSSGQPLLVFYGGGGSYSGVVEKVIRILKISVNPVGRVRHKFTFRAVLRHGDGVRAPDGTVGVLQWKRAKGTPGPGSFTRLAGARSRKGTLKFKARLPRSAQKRVQVRACVIQPDQPEGGTRCTDPKTLRLKK